ALAAAAGDEVHAAGVAAQRDERAGDIGRLGVVDEGDAAGGGDQLEPVCDAREAAQAGGHRVALDAAGQARGGDRHGVGAVVQPGQRDLGDVDDGLVVPPQVAGPVRQLGALGPEWHAAGTSPEILDVEVQRRD